ncbi:antibiotic biosynthesis monooxygenase family protein [Sphingomonas montanisoli]|uniref:Antibiotic biosynthesis monooxygenase n=1 Tax=Sphingomonas montanisoli TaxID=2606412 RepID=A0A5D9CGC9_9SPHN|nr:antibiotic biosynthesis monooxygenase family protein [Sphingomonas montanisoli]TZG29115.1 antibiotic biosynthesis monooxygenase [Sphingomonas montanisoli]
MIKELAEIDIKPGHEQAFEDAARQAMRLFLGSQGCLAFRIHRSIEQPSRYRMFVEWETIEDHMVEFRNSDAFLTWRKLCGPHFQSPPRVEHLQIIIDSDRDPVEPGPAIERLVIEG